MKKGLVKSVPSGNAVMLEGQCPPGGLPPQRTIYLAYVDVPTLGLPGMTSEPLGWEAREFLRRELIGKVVSFQMEYQLRKSEYGLIYVDDELINLKVVREGLGRVRTDKQSPIQDQLLQVENEAKRLGRGIWSASQPEPVTIKTVPEFDPRPLLNKRHPCIVEEAINAMTLSLLILKDMVMIRVQLEGVTCPPPSNKIGLDGKFYTQRLLLNRELECELTDLDQHNIFTGRIIHPNGDITVQLLKNGYAKITQQCNELSFTSAYHRQLKEAQNLAQNKRLRLWEEHKVQRVDVNEKKFQGRVCEINSGDSITIRSLNTGITKRLFLASLRAPALGNAKKGTTDAPWSIDAREFLRKLIIGKKVEVEVEYARKIPAEGGENTLEFATVLFKDQNVGELLAAQGLAHVVSPRADEEGSRFLGKLREAEDRARAEKKGIHSNEQAPKYRVNELIGPKNLQKAKTFAPSLIQDKQVGVIEYIFTGTRFKVRIPKQNCAIMLGVLGIRSMAPDPNQPEQDKIAKDAIEYARSTLLQRDVEVEIYALDQKGTFLGTVFINKRNYSVPLLEQGLAFTQPSGGQPSPYRGQYEEAEESARRARVGVFDPKVSGLLGTGEGAATKESIPCVLTEIVDATRFYVQFLNDENMNRITRIMQEFNSASAPPLQSPIKTGVRCAAKFSQDGLWYRSRVEKKVGDKYRLFFIDYGNEEDVTIENLRQLTGPALEVPPLAHECSFAFIQSPRLEEPLGVEAAQTLRDLAWSQELFLKVQSEDKTGKLHVVLSRDPNELANTINGELVGRGLAKITSAAKMQDSNPYLPHLVSREDPVRRRKAGLWGIESVDEEDYDY